jgi:hypothetical protein
MRITDIALIVGALSALVMAVEARNHVDLGQQETPKPEVTMITCPLRKPDFATIMQAAFIGDGTLLVEQQTNTRVHHIRDC